ncbi:hypothetical protein D3C71_2184050 [compost metagenome]
MRRQRAAHDEREVHLALTEEGVGMRDKVMPLRNELICSSGLDLNEMAELRERLGELLGQLMGLPG